MEINKHQYDLSVPYSVSSYINSLLQHVNNPVFTDNVFANSNNYIVAISENGFFKKISPSLISSLGFSEVELFSKQANKIVTGSKFILEDNSRNYYFENSFCTKENTGLKIKWRLIPFVNEGTYVFVGWKIK